MAANNRARRNKIDNKGRSANPQTRFARLDHNLLHSAAYRSLNPAARSLLVELVSMHNNTNNGALWLSVRDAADRMGVSDTKTASRALRDLESAGFIDMTKDAFFSVKASATSRARCWRLTWEFDHANKKSASFRWKDWEPVAKTPEAKRADRGLRVIKAYRKAMSENKTPVVDSTTIGPKPSPVRAAPVVDSSTANTSFNAKQPFVIVADSSTHIATAIGNGAGVFQLGWWQHSELDKALCRLLFCVVVSEPRFGQLQLAA